MIYQNIILTIFLVSVYLLLWANMPNSKEVEQMKKVQADHNQYQKDVNEQSIELHKRMLKELECLYYLLVEIRNRV